MSISVKSNIDRVVSDMRLLSRDVLEAALPRALNRTMEMARTQSARDMVRDGYNFKASEIKAAMFVIKASRGMRGVRMRVARNTRSLMQFDARDTPTGVSVKVHKGRRTIKGAFIGQLQNGRYGVYVEDKSQGKLILRRAKANKKGSVGGWHAYPVRKLYGPSVGGAFVSQILQGLLEKYVGEVFPARLQHEIKRLSR